MDARQSSDDEGQEGNDIVYTYLFECSDPATAETLRILKGHGFDVGYKADDETVDLTWSALSPHAKTVLFKPTSPRTHTF